MHFVIIVKSISGNVGVPETLLGMQHLLLLLSRTSPGENWRDCCSLQKPGSVYVLGLR